MIEKIGTFECNPERESILETALARHLVVTNNVSKKKHIVTYQTSGGRIKIYY